MATTYIFFDYKQGLGVKPCFDFGRIDSNYHLHSLSITFSNLGIWNCRKLKVWIFYLCKFLNFVIWSYWFETLQSDNFKLVILVFRNFLNARIWTFQISSYLIRTPVHCNQRKPTYCSNTPCTFSNIQFLHNQRCSISTYYIAISTEVPNIPALYNMLTFPERKNNFEPNLRRMHLDRIKRLLTAYIYIFECA